MEHDISTSTLIVNLHIAQWSARREDRAETDGINAQHKSRKRAARVNKSLLPRCAALAEIQKASAELRNYVTRVSLPWLNDGARIIKASEYLDVMAGIASRKLKWEQLVNDFLADYDRYVIEAQQDLNTLYKADDYPTKAQVQRRFSVTASFAPVQTTTDFRVNLAAEHAAQIKAEMEAATKAQIDASMAVAYSKVRAVFAHAADKLLSEDAVFRDSLVKNVRAVCTNIDALNITNDERLTQLAVEMDNLFSAHSPKKVRENKTVRRDLGRRTQAAVAAVDEIMGSLGAFMSE